MSSRAGNKFGGTHSRFLVNQWGIRPSVLIKFEGCSALCNRQFGGLNRLGPVSAKVSIGVLKVILGLFEIANRLHDFGVLFPMIAFTATSFLALSATLYLAISTNRATLRD